MHCTRVRLALGSRHLTPGISCVQALLQHPDHRGRQVPSSPADAAVSGSVVYVVTGCSFIWAWSGRYDLLTRQSGDTSTSHSVSLFVTNLSRNQHDPRLHLRNALVGRTTCAVQIALGAVQWRLQLSFTPHPSDEIQAH